MPRNVRNACVKALEDMMPGPEIVEKYKSRIPNRERAGYWRMVMGFGESYYKTAARRADSMLSVLEERRGKGGKK
jgi:broad specificity phosphatase PhoE